jgi:hypothetical protein
VFGNNFEANFSLPPFPFDKVDPQGEASRRGVRIREKHADLRTAKEREDIRDRGA